jgi:hypothetical protein
LITATSYAKHYSLLLVRSIIDTKTLLVRSVIDTKTLQKELCPQKENSPIQGCK